LSLVFLARHAAPALYYVGLFDISALAIFRSVRFIHLNPEVLVFRYEGTNVKILSDASRFNSHVWGPTNHIDDDRHLPVGEPNTCDHGRWRYNRAVWLDFICFVSQPGVL
jgi:hypothetical protein